jgi:hypothetical protein
MDELTIADQKYLSSKKAAKLTGYAKDYVGQLCREGRVEARLVGRNWYVLESSILEHRFGPAETQSTDPVGEKQEDVVEYKWNAPVYTPEPSQELPAFLEKEAVNEVKPVVESDKNMLSDMQSAWQEWFKTQQSKEKALPDASEMLLAEGDEVLPEQKSEIYQNDQESVIKQSPIEESVPVIRNHDVEQVYEEIKITKRSNYIEPEPYTRSYPEAPKMVPQPRYDRGYKDQATYIRKAPKRTTRSYKRGGLVLQTIFLSIAGLFVAATILASSTASESEQTNGNSFYKFINGVSTVESSK